MDLITLTFFLGFLLTVIIIIPRLRKSDYVKLVNSNVSAKVYDVTSYVEEHPGGDAILAHAGDDSTEGFFGPQHATRVFDMIEDFYIGDLVE